MAVYMDHAATTPLDERVLEAMLPHMKEQFGNPSSVHQRGRKARYVVESCRETVADLLGAEPGEIIFTSGGTEADNTALRGVLSDARPHLITSAAEHEAILRVAEHRAAAGYPTSILAPAPTGAVTAAQVEEELRPTTGLVSLMHANNEIGTVTDVSAVAAVCRAHEVPFHTDAVQTAGLLPIDVDTLGVDLLSLSAHKFYGPKGVGALFVRSGVELDPFVRGGKQERDRRGGTENVPGIVGLTEALKRAHEAQATVADRITTLRDRLIEGLQVALDPAQFAFNTPVEAQRAGTVAIAPHVVNVSFRPQGDAPVDGEMLLLNLDMKGIQASAGSACTSGALAPSHVLTAIGRGRAMGSAAVRFSLGRSTTAADVDQAVDALAQTIDRMHRHRRPAPARS